MVQGRKIAGSAQRRIRRSFLQHGSLLITCDRDALARITRLADVRELDQAMAGVAEFLPGRPKLEELTTAFIQAFQDYFTVEFML
jgi:lipoate-protein ligase A